MFLAGRYRSLTMNQFNSPPSMVLDLGCGGGLWALEAAKAWKVRIVCPFESTPLGLSIGRNDNWLRH